MESNNGKGGNWYFTLFSSKEQHTVSTKIVLYKHI